MRSKGFTLIEILVVLVIMAVVISLAVLSIGTTGRDSQLDEESRRIEGLVDILHERALLEGRDFGLRIEPTGYGVRRLLGRPRPLAAAHRRARVPPPRPAQGRDLSAGARFRDGRAEALEQGLSSDDPPPPPQVAIAASGEGTPFRLTLLRDATQARASVNGDAFGKTSQESSDHPPAEALVRSRPHRAADSPGRGTGRARWWWRSVSPRSWWR
jgi:general secretion pathway protein H